MSAANPASAAFDRLYKTLTSTVALKILVALTGFGMAGFVFIHMAGNLQVFMGRETYNAYAENMQALGAIKWAARLGLLATLGGHVTGIALLYQRNKAARPQAYEVSKYQRTTPYARMMNMLGAFLLLFIIFHLFHFVACLT